MQWHHETEPNSFALYSVRHHLCKMSNFSARPFILASSSSRRRSLLELAECSFSVMVPDSDESFPESLTPREAAVHVAREKAAAVHKARREAGMDGSEIILAADTMVVLDDQILGKPLDRSDAIGMLTRLSGREHEVVTGVCMIIDNEYIAFHEVSLVCFGSLTTAQIEHYVDAHAPYDKAGSYAIQEWIGLIGIRYIHGDYYNVMGLPICRILSELRRVYPS